jgi:serine/threonine protein phosphatase 1
MPEEWWQQGGEQTVKSYKDMEMPPEHVRFLSEAKLYFVDQNRVFVHGGFNPDHPVEDSLKEIVLWDRNLLKKAQELNRTEPNHKFGNYDEIYIGHTPTINYGKKEPQKYCNVWAMDTGAGWGAKLTIMDIDTKQFWQA